MAAERKPRKAAAKKPRNPPAPPDAPQPPAAKKRGQPKQTAKDKALRNAEIVQYRLDHPTMPWSDIAEVFKVSRSTACEAWARWEDSEVEVFREALKLISSDPTGYVAAKIESFKKLQEAAEKLLTNSEYEAVKLGAIRAILDVHSKEISLLQQTKMLPQDLGHIRHIFDLRFTARVMLDVIDDFVPAEHQARAKTRLREATRGVVAA